MDLDPVNLDPVNLDHINLNDLKNEIISLPADVPAFIYIGVGAAAATVNNKLQLEHYQQFPPFLQDMYNKIPDLHIFLLLIDPFQENPPRVAIDYDLEDRSNNDHYRGRRLQAFVYRQRVYTDADMYPHSDMYPDNNALNITKTLRDLNDFAKEKEVSLVYHDFSGRRVAAVAEYFDHENIFHLDQIIYGISGREDHGCFFDLTQLTAYFPFRIDQRSIDQISRPVIKMFNYYKYIINNTIEESEAELKKYAQEMWEWAEVQKNQIIKNIREQFKVTNLSILRQVRKLILEPPDQAPADQAPADPQANYVFHALPHFYSKMFIDLFNEKEYDLLYELLFNYSASELDILAKLKKIDISGEELLTFITLNEDPYKWYNTLNEVMP